MIFKKKFLRIIGYVFLDYSILEIKMDFLRKYFMKSFFLNIGFYKFIIGFFF